MNLHPTDRTALFIDGANLYSAARSLNVELDFRKMLEWFRERTKLTRAYYYTAVTEGEEFSPIKPLVDWLGYNGFSVVTKPARRFTDADGHRRIKGNMDIEIAVDMMELAPHLDHAVLFSGDGDFRPMASDDLRRQADAFVDLADMTGEFGRPKPLRDDA